jgi:hypothetical protein
MPLAARMAVVWAYFNNATGGHEATFAERSMMGVIYRDIGATIPT